MTAKEMFEELGFHLDSENGDYLIWENRQGTRTVKFYKKYKAFEYGKYSLGSFYGFSISTPLFLAITQQMKELGWIE